MPVEPDQHAHPNDHNPPPPGRTGREQLLRGLLWAVTVLIAAIIGAALVYWGGKWAVLFAAFALILTGVVIAGIVTMRWIVRRLNGGGPAAAGARRVRSARQRPPDGGTAVSGRQVPASATPQAAPSQVTSPPVPAPPALARTGVAQDSPSISRTSSGDFPAVSGNVPVMAAHSDGTAEGRLDNGEKAPQSALVQPKGFRRHQSRLVDSRHAGYCLDQSGTDRLFILAGSALGATHDQRGLMREDDVFFDKAFLAEPDSATTVVAAVADGVSTARQSHLTSALAVRLAVHELSSWLTEAGPAGLFSDWQPTAHRLVAAVADKLAAELDETPGSHQEQFGTSPVVEENYAKRPGKPAATLAVLATAESPDGLCAWWLTVGDCQVAVVDTVTGKVDWLTKQTHRRDLAVDAVPSRRQATAGGRAIIMDGTAVVAMTDGMAHLLDEDSEHLSAALAAASWRESAVGSLLSALDARQHGNHDDRSLVAIGPVRRN